jgi:penicillin amidase
MRVALRWLLRILGVLVLVLVVLSLGLAAMVGVVTWRAFPQTSGTLHLPGLQGSVTVDRDANGVVQIYADSSHDLFLAQGYVHAQERLWQMEVWRHIGAGRLAELFGPSQVDTDRFIRTLGWRQAAARDLAAMEPQVVQLLQAYADGVNAYIQSHAGGLGLPFVVVGLQAGLGGGLGGYTPEPWTPLDTATWQKVESWQLAGNLDSEIFRLLADARLGSRDQTDRLFPPYPPTAPTILGSAEGSSGGTAAVARGDAGPVPPTGAAVAAALASHLARLDATIGALTGLQPGAGLGANRGLGSNNWVVGPSRSSDGHPLLANDPHLGISLPSVWIVNGLHCRAVSAACPWDVVGVSFPGAPGVILGHNGAIAWGATNLGPDVQDLYLERPDPTDPTRYLYRGESLPFTVRHEVIRVAGGSPVTLDVRETVHGPILNDVDPLLKSQNQLVSLRWVATAQPDLTLQAFLHLDLAHNWEEFRAALRDYGTPSQNFVYADVHGHIGYLAPGAIPIRPPGDLGDRPVPGWDGAHEWTGMVPFDQLPQAFDPPTGRIVTANNDPVPPGYPYRLGQEWDPGYRAARILQLLDAAGPHGVTPGLMASIQLDSLVLRANAIAPALTAASPTTADGRLLQDRIRSWDRTCPTESLGCAAYMAAEYRLLRALFDARLGPTLAREYVGSPFSWQALAALLEQPDDPWWDDPSTPGVRETRDTVVAAALDAAASDLRRALGDPGNWTWGRLHTATFREATLGSSGIAPLEWYFNRGPFPAAGAPGAPNNAYVRFSEAYPDPTNPAFRPTDDLRVLFAVTNLPSMRFVVDMGDLDAAQIVITTGESGQPFAPHYDDLINDYLTGRTIPLPFSPAAVRAATTAELTLLP